MSITIVLTHEIDLTDLQYVATLASDDGFTLKRKSACLDLLDPNLAEQRYAALQGLFILLATELVHQYPQVESL